MTCTVINVPNWITMLGFCLWFVGGFGLFVIESTVFIKQMLFFKPVKPEPINNAGNPISEKAVAFLRRLAAHDGCCDREQSGPVMDRNEDRARQKCRRLGWAEYENGYWRLTSLGRQQLETGV